MTFACSANFYIYFAKHSQRVQRLFKFRKWLRRPTPPGGDHTDMHDLHGTSVRGTLEPAEDTKSSPFNRRLTVTSNGTGRSPASSFRNVSFRVWKTVLPEGRHFKKPKKLTIHDKASRYPPNHLATLNCIFAHTYLYTQAVFINKSPNVVNSLCAWVSNKCMYFCVVSIKNTICAKFDVYSEW